MTPEFTPMDAALEQAVAEIRDEAVDPAAIEAAAARVWARLSDTASAQAPSAAIRNCADFQALIPEFRAGRLSEARVMLLQDHLHQCVACRHIFEGRVVAMPAPPEGRPVVRPRHRARWAMAATVLLAAGVTIWWYVDQNGQRSGPAIVQSLDGSLFVVSAEGIRPLKTGQDLPAGLELRTAKDSDAVLKLSDGSQVEMRERSSLYTTAGASDITIRLGRGSVIVQAAHRGKGHLYVDTGDCQVAVTGTLFGVTAGVKGSRISVVQGEVHVTQDNQERILHAGDQTVTSASVEPEPVSAEISWSRNHAGLLKQLNLLRASLEQARMPALRYSSQLVGRLPAGTTLFLSIPNLAQYLADAESVLGKKLGANPQLSSLWNSRLGAAVEMLRTGSEYLGDEIDMVAGPAQGMVLVAEQRREGFEEFLHKKGLPLKVVNRGGVLLFGPDAGAVEAAADQLDSGFQSTPLYARIAESYREGAGLLIWADLAQAHRGFEGARYFSVEQKQTGGQMVASAALGFDGPRTGLAAQLAEPSPMGSLDYISPDATAVLGFVVKDPGAIVDLALSVPQGSFSAAQKTLADEHREKGFDVRDDLAASLGGEFAFALDGPLMPVPSWKLVSEVYDPNRFQASLQRFVDRHNQEMAQTGKKPLHTAQETFEGRTYYTIAAVDSGPLMEAHYTFDQGYLIAGPTRALVYNALRLKTAGTSIKHSARFLALTPRDRHVNFSVVIYQNLGTSMAPLAALAGAFMPPGGAGRGNLLQGLSNVKPALYAVYGEPDCITMTANGDVLGSTLASLLSGNILGMTGIPLPIGQMMGTHAPQASYAGR
jgi:ferric-dicitrate binding protein FerR (iron transport regulator)